MTSIRWLGSPTCSAASPTSHRAGFPNCCHGIGNIRTCGRPLELWRPSPTSSRSGVLPRSWAAMKTCYGSCPTSSSPKTGSCGFTISMALKSPPSHTMASRLFAKLSRIRSIAPVNLKTSVPRCSAYAYQIAHRHVVDHAIMRWRRGEIGLVIGGLLSVGLHERAILADRTPPTMLQLRLGRPTDQKESTDEGL